MADRGAIPIGANDWRFDIFKSAAREAYGATQAGALRKAIGVAREHYTRGGAIPQATRLAAAYQRGGVKGFMRAAGNRGGTWQAVERYARAGGSSKKLVDQFLKQLGPIGRIIGAMVGKGGTDPTLPTDLRSALDFIRAFSDQPSVIKSLQNILEGQGAKVSWPGGKPGDESGLPRKLAGEIARAIETAAGGMGREKESPPPSGPGGGGRGRPPRPPAGGTGEGGEPGGHDDGRVPVDVDGRTERLPPNHPLVTGEMIETPESSNVYAFGFDNSSHSLFVRFKDRVPPGYTGNSGDRGRPHRPGALYLYHNVAARLFIDFISKPSKGSWVWDNLRIRGTVSGHQKDYALVGVQNEYVPRKATLTPHGEEYIPRSVFTDQRRELSSSLPRELVRPLGRPPNDGSRGLRGK